MEYQYNSDLLDVDVQIIAQQCNCVSKQAKGLSADIAARFPHADFYSKRSAPSTPGTIEVRGGKGKRWVCAMYAQYRPGPPTEGDSGEDRVAWFKECLTKISRIKNLRHIAFPDKIGCGLAQGDWSIYYAMLYQWAEQQPNIKVSLISKEASPEASPESPPEASPEDLHSYETTNLVEYTQSHLPVGWEEFFISQLDPELGAIPEISAFLEKEIKTSQIFPPLDLVYTSFNLVQPKDVSVVIIGQDPYHDDGQAMGVSFSVPENITPPPSLKNIQKEMMTSGIQVSDLGSGDLTPWCRQGVFLINTALTVRAHTPKSHSKRWVENFTPSLLRWMNDRCQPLVVIMWGNDAQNLGKHFGDRHRKISSVHPSPMSAHNGFFGSDPFNRANKYLRDLKRPIIDWSL